MTQRGADDGGCERVTKRRKSPNTKKHFNHGWIRLRLAYGGQARIIGRKKAQTAEGRKAATRKSFDTN